MWVLNRNFLADLSYPLSSSKCSEVSYKLAIVALLSSPKEKKKMYKFNDLSQVQLIVILSLYLVKDGHKDGLYSLYMFLPLLHQEVQSNSPPLRNQA